MRVELIYFNAGGGHRSTALALQEAIRQGGLPWETQLVNLAEMLDPADRFRRATGMAPEDIYNLRLARGWTLGLAQELKILQAAIRLANRAMARILSRRWLLSRPDLVVSLIPNFNRAMCLALQRARPAVPYVTLMTDLADYPPNFWIESDVPQHVICGTARAIEQARSLGLPAHHIHAVSGMVLHPRFYAPRGAEERLRERARLGLAPTVPTGMVMFGGHGAPAMLKIARQLPDTPLLLICGHNARLAERLRAIPSRAPHIVLGFVSDMPLYMHLCDFFIGKPGPGAISEAIQQQLPVIVVSNALTMPQERYNARWIRERGVGLVLKSFREIAPSVSQLCEQLPAYRARTQQIHNRAVFEIPPILERILEAAVETQSMLA
jgi:UDP-N-acetylglucosamine:LPS N-acetylglucosamine transferase